MGIEYRLPSETWPPPPEGAPADDELVDLWASETGCADPAATEAVQDREGQANA